MLTMWRWLRGKCFTYDYEVVESGSDVDSEISDSNLMYANHPNEACVEKLKSLRENFNLEVKEERYDLLDQLNSLICHWRGPRPNLRDIFRPEEIERLLFDTIVYEIIKYEDSCVTDLSFIAFVARSGYKQELELGEDSKISPRRTTPIHHANQFGYYKIIPDLFKIYNKFDVNYVDEFGITHFHVACKFGCEDAVEKFLRFGQDPNRLWHKTKESSSDMSLDNYEDKYARSLLRCGYSLDPVYSDRSAALRHLIQSNVNISSAELFIKISDELKKPSQVNIRYDWSNRPLLLSLVYKNKKVAELLLKKGANPNLSELEEGWTALHIVSMGDKFYDMAKMLFKICDDKHQPLLVDAQDRLGKTPLHLALESSSYGKKNMIELLLRHGADPNSTYGWGYTLLHGICTHNHDLRFGTEILFQVCRKINRTVEVNARDKYDQWAGALATIERLRERGYELDQSDALKIMKIFAIYGLFKKSTDVLKSLYDDKKFARKKPQNFYRSYH
ncbi:unnamed protein product [Trichogramma brassicae]|uniref:Uncharacterized protein n=1 Tax=Trichogramma brassicae TaxID=86971 RepID=A0A6H5IWI3_9HYME|nr:unnamed protein product [Trichogramma brassicae]